jgi:EamA domain-containing membrane protein RarD
MRTLYFWLTVVGTIVPLVLFVEHFVANGADPLLFVRSAFANLVAAGATADLLIASAVFWVWIFARHGSDRTAPSPWMFVVLNVCVGLSCALPLYLYMTARETARVGVLGTAVR